MAVELFGLLRRMTSGLIRSLPASARSRTLDHPERGRMTLDDWRIVYTNHVHDPIRQMQATYQAWRSPKKGRAADPSTSLFRPTR